MSYVNREYGWESFTHVSCRHVAWEGFLCCLLIIATGSERKGMRNDISKMQTDKERKMGYVYHFWQEFSVLCCVRWFRFQESYCIGIDCPKKNSPEIFYFGLQYIQNTSYNILLQVNYPTGGPEVDQGFGGSPFFQIKIRQTRAFKKIHTHLQYNCTWKWILFYYSAL